MVSLLSQSDQFPETRRDPETQEMIETYIVNFLLADIQEGIRLGIITMTSPEQGYSLYDVMKYSRVEEDFDDFSEKFGVDPMEAWLIFIRKTNPANARTD